MNTVLNKEKIIKKSIWRSFILVNEYESHAKTGSYINRLNCYYISPYFFFVPSFNLVVLFIFYFRPRGCLTQTLGVQTCW